MATQIEKLTAKAVLAGNAMFPKPIVLTGKALTVKKALDAVSANSGLRSVIGAVIGADLTDVRVTPKVGAVIVVTSKDAGHHHGYALKRPAMISRVNGDGTVSCIRFHSGNVVNTKTLRASEYRKATKAEVVKFLTTNWATTRKRTNVEAIFGR